ncbi:hypothetical protein AG1IA_06373 [Rhizoctonia solani AG-1 IA]|uniref:Uncharacterized protein n=1 Tax=Thanatephorus cucumeris (strain AG1-IA) TaxID=983506 RepID=L8WT90_THACA|nr:hypothetical protein AG1IA_06373 [Rhizoctonia solani AG-1 IA]
MRFPSTSTPAGVSGPVCAMGGFHPISSAIFDFFVAIITDIVDVYKCILALLCWPNLAKLTCQRKSLSLPYAGPQGYMDWGRGIGGHVPTQLFSRLSNFIRTCRIINFNLKNRFRDPKYLITFTDNRGYRC